MKKIIILALGLVFQTHMEAQCGSPVTGGGSATSFLTGFTRGAINPVAADKNLNTVAFIHRTNTVTAGGTMGNIVYDISTNGGTSWTPNSTFLNPLVTSFARFPNITIYNPPSNTNPNNAYIGYMASTGLTYSNTVYDYNGVVTGVRQISGTGNTEHYNQPIVNPSFIAESLVKGAPGVFWAVDALHNGTYVTGFTVYKGVWNNSTNDLTWSNNFNVSPSFNTGFTPSGAVPADYNIAFDPTGNIGYISFMGHLAAGPAGFAYYPILYKTTNGGNTWTGPIVVDVTQFSCLTANVGVGNIPSAGFEHDLVVDVNGNPHLVTCLLNGDNAYAVYYGLWHHLYDITLKNGLWAAYDLSNLNAGRGTWGINPNWAVMDIFPRIARSADGTKIFYTWADNATYLAGAANLTPNLFSKAYNVTTDMWTQTRDFTSCNASTDGKILFPHLAPEVLEPGAGSYKLAAVYGEFSSPANDPNINVNFKFLDNLIYATSEFSVATPAAMVNIQQAPGVVLCSSNAVTLNLTNNVGQFLWSTGATTNTLAITAGTATSYSVVAQQGCLVGTASIAVSNLTLNLNSTVQNICNGSGGTFSVSGNALSYSWLPGSLSGSNVVIYPTVSTLTLNAYGSGGCIESRTVAVNILPQPTLSITGSNSVCAGNVLTLNATGAQTYLWDNSSTQATFTDTPLSYTTYTVIGTAANTCTNSKSFTVSVLTSPTVNALVSQTMVCNGTPVSLVATGALTYSLNGVSSPAVISVTPNITTTYSITGGAANSCENTKTVTITVNALPTLTITSPKARICKGEKIKLTASGAATYTWSAPGSLSSTIQVGPATNTSFSVYGTSLEGCENSQTFALVVDACAGIEDLSMEPGILVYPNPNKGVFTVKAAESMALTVVNHLGQTIQTFEINENTEATIQLKDVSAGVYFILGKKDRQIIKQKIIITD